MKFILSIVLASVVVLTGCNLQSTTPTTEDVVLPIDKTAETMDNIVIVGYKDTTYKNEAVQLIQSIDSGATIRADLSTIKAISFKTSLDLKSIKSGIKTAFETNANLKDKFSYIEPSYKRYLIEPITNNNLKSESILKATAKAKTFAYEDDEAYWKYLWGIRMIKAPEVWNTGYTGNGITVAVVDTGVDGTHPDLQGQLVTGYRPYTGDTLPADADNSYGGAHGTHVSGTIAAKNDGKGVVGVAPHAKIMPIIIFDTDAGDHDGYYIGDDLVAEGLLWAAEHDAKIFSNSWGGKGYSSILAYTISYIMANYNGVFVASAGNSHTDEIHYPSCYPGVINVAASNAEDEITQFSTRGRWVTVAAPGDTSILSTVPQWDEDEFFDGENPYALYGGTSMATPHVTATIALELEKLGDTSYTPYQIRKLISETADDIQAEGFDTDSGWGRVNAKSAIDAVLPSEEGSNVVLFFNTPYAYVSMYPEDSDVPVYYGKADSEGVLPITGIEPGTYTIYCASGDAWYAGIDVENQVAFSETITLDGGINRIDIQF